MRVSKGRVSQIEPGKISGQDVLARYATALGGRVHQTIYFDDGDITAIRVSPVTTGQAAMRSRRHSAYRAPLRSAMPAQNRRWS